MDSSTALTFTALIYAAFAASVVVRLARAGRKTFDDQFSRVDRQLLGAATFYLLIPLATLAQQLGRVVAVGALGGSIEKFRFVFYFGEVVPARAVAFSNAEQTLIALAGSAVSLLLAVLAIVWTRLQKFNAAWNFVRLEFARVMLTLTLVVYPLLSLVLDWGDFAQARRALNGISPNVGDFVVAALIASGLVCFWLFRRGVWRRDHLFWSTPLWDEARRQIRRIAEDPAGAHRELGKVFLRAERLEDARRELRQSESFAAENPETLWLLGLAELRERAAQKASSYFRRAGLALESATEERRELRNEVLVGLAGARLLLEDPEGAAEAAEAAREINPRDARSLLVLADAWAGSGRLTDARRILEGALVSAQGVVAFEIRRRLASLASLEGA